MFKMKKTLTLLLAFVLITAFFPAAAFASEAETAPSPTPEATAEPTPELTPEPTPELTPEPTVAPTASPAPTAAPSATPAPTAVPTATPAPTATPQPTPNKLPAKITKHPGGETVNAGGEALFTSGAENYKEIIWRIVSEDTKTTYIAKDAPGYFKGLEVSMYKQESTGNEAIRLKNIPASMNRWRVEAKFIGNDGKAVYSYGAQIIIAGASNTPAPTATVKPEFTPTPAATPSPTAEVTPFPPTPGIDTEPIPTPSYQPDTTSERSSSSGLLLLIASGILAAGLAAYFVYRLINEYRDR